MESEKRPDTALPLGDVAPHPQAHRLRPVGRCSNQPHATHSVAPTNRNARTNMKIIARRDALLLVVVVHVAIDVVLISRGAIDSSTIPGVVQGALAAFPMAQGCLIAIWAANGRIRFFLRLPVAMLAMLVPLIALLRVTATNKSDLYAPAFAFLLLTQLLTILILINGGRLVRRLHRLWRSGWTAADARPMQFTLRQMLLWTAILALIMGTGKALFGWLGWTADVFVGEEFYAVQLFAVYNAVYALLTLTLFTAPVRWQTRILLIPWFALGVGALACSMPLVSQYMPGIKWWLDVYEALLLAIPQFIYHTMTLWPLWLCGYIGQRAPANSSPHEPTPASDNPFAR